MGSSQSLVQVYPPIVSFNQPATVHKDISSSKYTEVSPASKAFFVTSCFPCKQECLHGKQFVTKKAFEAGETSVYLDELMSLCTVAGWLNETIGGYTCTKDCEEPM